MAARQSEAPFRPYRSPAWASCRVETEFAERKREIIESACPADECLAKTAGQRDSDFRRKLWTRK